MTQKTEIDVDQLRADIEETGADGPWNHYYIQAYGLGKDADIMAARSRRLSRLPKLEAAYLALRDENERLREAGEKMTDAMLTTVVYVRRAYDDTNLPQIAVRKAEEALTAFRNIKGEGE